MKTGTLFLINSNLKFKRTIKDRLFYDLYQYSVSFHLDEVSALRELNHQYIDVIIERRRQWREISLQRWTNSVQSNKNIITRRAKDITDETVINLHALTDVLLRSRVEFKLVTSVSTAWVYTNDIQLLETLDELDFLIWKNYSEAVVDRPKNTIKLKEPKHKYRSYLKCVKLTDEEKTHLCNFFANQHGHARISPALLKWMGERWHRTQDYFFVDHDDESWLVMLSLIKPSMIRKTVELIAA
jgi:hypothetical protein